MKNSITILLVSMLFASTASLCMGQTTTTRESKKRTPTVAQKTAQNQQRTVKSKKVIFTCPMHASVLSDKPGKCPDCKMNLVQKNQAADVFTCSMHPEIVKAEAGKCPKCKMNLVKKENKESITPKKI